MADNGSFKQNLRTSHMTTSLLRATFVATLFVAGCGGGEETAPATKEAAADSKGASKKKGAPVANTSRADELIADLKAREAKQAEIQREHDSSKPSGIPVVVEVTPQGKGGKGGKGGSSTYVQSYSAQPSGGYSSGGSVPVGATGVDASVLRQEIMVAEARLQENQRKLDAARQRMTAASSQMNDQNAAVRQMGQDALRSAQQEVSALEGAVSQDRYALDAARQRAANAGVTVR
jgi:hypothetical protein